MVNLRARANRNRKKKQARARALRVKLSLETVRKETRKKKDKKANRSREEEKRATLRGRRLELVLKRVKVPLMRMLKEGRKLTMPRYLVTAAQLARSQSRVGRVVLMVNRSRPRRISPTRNRTGQIDMLTQARLLKRHANRV
jgi:hypothetical protein